MEQIQRSLSGSGSTGTGRSSSSSTRCPRHEAAARQLLAGGHAYEDEGAIRFRMPDEGVDRLGGRDQGADRYPNEKLEDLVLLRSDGRPTYNLAAALDDADSGITHVIRGEDHVSNTPKQIRILEALGRELPVYAHVPNVFGTDGKKLSKRHGAVSWRSSATRATSPPALMNYLALLGWSYDDKTTIMSRDELVERFSLDRVGVEPGDVRLREARLDERRLSAGAGARGLRGRARRVPARAGLRRATSRRSAHRRRSSRRRSRASRSIPAFAGFLFRRVEPPAELLEAPSRYWPRRARRWPASSPSRPSPSRRRCAGWPSGWA